MSFKPSDVLRFLGGLAAVAVIAALVFLRVTQHAPAPVNHAPPAPPPPAPAPVATAQGCEAPAWADAARANAQSLETLAWAPFGRPETGWHIYAHLIGREIGTRCGPATPGFAAAYARWQASRGMPADGVFTPAAFAPMLVTMELRRPFVRVNNQGVCPPPPAESALQAAGPEEGYGRKVVMLRATALAAYRRMAAEARAAGVIRDPDDFKLVSGFRGPTEEAARCADGGCNTVSKASCSAHRTGLAVDIYLGRAAGSDPISSSEENRRAIVATPAYRWLVVNADRFGFVNYPFEPWHWEWTGEPP